MLILMLLLQRSTALRICQTNVHLQKYCYMQNKQPFADKVSERNGDRMNRSLTLKEIEN